MTKRGMHEPGPRPDTERADSKCRRAVHRRRRLATTPALAGCFRSGGCQGSRHLPERCSEPVPGGARPLTTAAPGRRLQSLPRGGSSTSRSKRARRRRLQDPGPDERTGVEPWCKAQGFPRRADKPVATSTSLVATRSCRTRKSPSVVVYPERGRTYTPRRVIVKS